MWKDPIVEEVRKAREELARRANYDFHTFFENLRRNEKKRKNRVVSRVKDEVIHSSEHDRKD
jgi:hypothetical protein